MQSGSRCIPAYWFLTTPGKYTLVQLIGVRYVYTLNVSDVGDAY